MNPKLGKVSGSFSGSGLCKELVSLFCMKCFVNLSKKN